MRDDMGSIDPERSPIFGAHAAPTIGWLLTEGQRHTGIADLLANYAGHLRQRGVPLAQATLHVRLLHPQIRGITYIWKADRAPGQPQVEEFRRAHDIETAQEFRDGSIAAIIEDGSEGMRFHLESLTPPYPFPVLNELRADGVTDYAAMPMRFSFGAHNVATFAATAPGGFGTADLTLFYEALPALTALVEARSLRLLSENLLNTYVGPEAGSRILQGDVRRGSGMTIAAVLWYCDLRGFTLLADQLSQDQLIALLNGYFEIMGGAVQRHGGEILKFIGDAMLAIFPVQPTAGSRKLAEECARALRAASEALAGMRRLNEQRAIWGHPALGAGIALHVGDVMYGNIGAPDRLDFTVIGPAVNLVTRLERLTRRFERDLVASAGFARTCPKMPLESLGFHPIKGLREPVEVFGLKLPPPA